ncbi:hypothetical protein C6369_000525 [Rhodococcus rhodochrous]|uniref:hypothetical protein n=1 Tax=Rhodococcus rhodochrous TaxID=1829 RepID=UPI000D049956|nr:hypothetical protein [Rhodococcus rhodochrous]AYA23212.1 hypothetical protein C6369_000525 [Rhodococcus rhodochrous]
MGVHDDGQGTDAQLLVPADQVQQWATNTYRVRSCELVLSRTVDPLPGSQLDRADAIYRWEKISVWARSYLLAATESLCLWADLVAPYDLVPDAVNRVRMRPYLLLARSGLEAAAHAIWLLDVPTRTFEECVKRHVRLMHHDFTLHKQALEARGSDAGRIEDRIAKLKERAAGLPFEVTPTDKPPGYEKLVRNAATVVGKDANEWAYLWQAASGAGHGQNWFGIEGFDLRPTREYEPGHFRTMSVPDSVYITEMIEAAAAALAWGTTRWLDYGGHDRSLMFTAMREVHARMPKKPGVTSS